MIRRSPEQRKQGGMIKTMVSEEAKELPVENAQSI